MRKSIIALILVIPLLFIFVVFSSGNAASLGVEISAKSIEILDKPQNSTLPIDMAKMSDENFNGDKLNLEVNVLPENASNREYTFRVYNISGDGTETESTDTVEMNGNRIVPKKAGTVRVVAVSNDGGFTDSIKVIVSSSKPYDFDFFLYALGDGDMSDNLLSPLGESGYSTAAPLYTGSYVYRTKIIPSGYSSADIRVKSGFAKVSAGEGILLIPFSGKTELSVTVEGGLNGVIEKTVKLDVEKRNTGSGFTVNGRTDPNPVLTVANSDAGDGNITFYVESDGIPAISGDSIFEWTVKEIENMNGCYKVTVLLNNYGENETSFKVTVGSLSRNVTVRFQKFGFTVNSTLPIGEDRSVSILAGTPFSFYAVPYVTVSGITYSWTVENGAGRVDIHTADDGGICTLTAEEYGGFTLVARALRDGNIMAIDPVEIEVSVVRNVTALNIGSEISDRVLNSLAGKPAIAGKKFDESGKITDNLLNLEITGYNNAEILDGVNLADDLELAVSNRRLATVIPMYDSAILDPRGTGEVVITVSWKGNETFGTEVGDSLSLIMAANATEVYTADQLTEIADEGREVVLGNDIVLGTNGDGTDKSEGERMGILDSHRLKSTYNIEYYKNLSRENEAYVRYALEFKNNVYGNDYSINAEKFTNAQDGSGVPLFFKGPLALVSLQGAVSVAAQDNIAFLVRTDGVTLYNITLMGCGDESLLTEDGRSDLSKLNNVGTTLEINGDNVQILNCRIKNGRNVVRAYGGNRSGNRYFIDRLAFNTGCDSERIHVNIEGCIVSQGREFLLKTGVNRALRAGEMNGGNEPDLLNSENIAYEYQTNKYADDMEFYSRYVMTDVTLKDSVLETSGLFAVGMESNFAGAYLGTNEPSVRFDGWAGTGGTSFASLLSLVGDVRIYDWKNIDLVDSSTLIESNVDLGDLSPMVKLDIEAMIKFVRSAKEGYGNIVQEVGDNEFVHGGIACYGGGKNYAQISFGGLNEPLKDFTQYNINIGVLAESDDPVLQRQGQILPNAAGTRDFRFFMYGADSLNNYDKQIADTIAGAKYNGVKAVKCGVKGCAMHE